MHTMNNELDPATVFSFGVELQFLKCYVIESQPKREEGASNNQVKLYLPRNIRLRWSSLGIGQ